jgi:peptidyl-prolyl cis-trans isomerase SurA
MRILRSVCLAVVVLCAPRVGAAQDTPVRPVLLDRVVAIVGDRPILITELYEALNVKIARNEPIARDTVVALRNTLNELIDEELLVQQAKRFEISIADIDLVDEVDRTIARQRGEMTDREFVAALREAGFGTPDDYRRKRIEELRRLKMQQQAVDSLKAKGRLPSMNVSDAEVQAVFDSLKRNFTRGSPTVSFRQIVMTPKPRADNEAAAKQFADSLHALVTRGVPMDSLARLFSADSGSGAQGGDLGWANRGAYVAEFDRYAFGLRAGDLSPVFRTVFGYHFLRVDRVRPAERRIRHILIVPERDSVDFQATFAVAERVVAAWRAGASYDSLVQAHHDMVEDRILADPFILDSLPASYRTALGALPPRAVSDPFSLPDPTGPIPKVAIVQTLTRSETGEPQLSQYQSRIRASLQQERSYRRLLDQLRRETFVEIKL